MWWGAQNKSSVISLPTICHKRNGKNSIKLELNHMLSWKKFVCYFQHPHFLCLISVATEDAGSNDPHHPHVSATRPLPPIPGTPEMPRTSPRPSARSTPNGKLSVPQRSAPTASSDSSVEELRREVSNLRTELSSCRETIAQLQHREKLLRERLEVTWQPFVFMMHSLVVSLILGLMASTSESNSDGFLCVCIWWLPVCIYQSDLSGFNL